MSDLTWVSHVLLNNDDEYNFKVLPGVFCFESIFVLANFEIFVLPKFEGADGPSSVSSQYMKLYISSYILYSWIFALLAWKELIALQTHMIRGQRLSVGCRSFGSIPMLLGWLIAVVKGVTTNTNPQLRENNREKKTNQMEIYYCLLLSKHYISFRVT